MRWLLGLACVALAAQAVAATWICSERTEIVTTTLVMVRCRASGTYTTGGDPFSNPSIDLCNSAHRIPRAAVASTAAGTIVGEGYIVALERSTHTVMLLSAAKIAADYALTEVPRGTSIEGATFMAIVECSGF